MKNFITANELIELLQDLPSIYKSLPLVILDDRGAQYVGPSEIHGILYKDLINRWSGQGNELHVVDQIEVLIINKYLEADRYESK